MALNIKRACHSKFSRHSVIVLCTSALNKIPFHP